MIATDLSNQKALDVDPKSVQQINFTGNINQRGQTTMFLLLKKQKKRFRFESIAILFCFNIIPV